MVAPGGSAARAWRPRRTAPSGLVGRRPSSGPTRALARSTRALEQPTRALAGSTRALRRRCALRPTPRFARAGRSRTRGARDAHEPTATGGRRCAPRTAAPTSAGSARVASRPPDDAPHRVRRPGAVGRAARAHARRRGTPHGAPPVAAARSARPTSRFGSPAPYPAPRVGRRARRVRAGFSNPRVGPPNTRVDPGGSTAEMPVATEGFESTRVLGPRKAKARVEGGVNARFEPLAAAGKPRSYRESRSQRALWLHGGLGWQS